DLVTGVQTCALPIFGAEIPILGTNAHWDPTGQYFVAEGDESDGTLRFYQAKHAIILNVELEHLDYYADLAAIDSVFSDFIAQTRDRKSTRLNSSHQI